MPMSTTLALLTLASASLPTPEAWLSDRQEGKNFALVDVFAHWCGPCARLDREVLKGQEFAKRRHQFRFLKVDGDQAAGEAWKKRYHVVGYPTVLLLNAQGEELTRIFGFATERSFWEQVDAALSGESAQLQVLRLQRGELKGAGMVQALKGMVVRGEPDYPALRLRYAEKLAPKDQEELDFFFAKFELLRSRKDYVAALQAFDRLLKQNPKLGPRIRSARLRALVALGRDGEAMAGLEAWAKASPNAVGSITWFCGKQNFAPKWAEALAREALKAKPDNAGLLDNLALLLVRQGRIEDAIEVIAQARKIEPEDAWLKLHEASLKKHGRSPL